MVALGILTVNENGTVSGEKGQRISSRGSLGVKACAHTQTCAALVSQISHPFGTVVTFWDHEANAALGWNPNECDGSRGTTQGHEEVIAVSLASTIVKWGYRIDNRRNYQNPLVIIERFRRS